MDEMGKMGRGPEIPRRMMPYRTFRKKYRREKEKERYGGLLSIEFNGGLFFPPPNHWMDATLISIGFIKTIPSVYVYVRHGSMMLQGS